MVGSSQLRRALWASAVVIAAGGTGLVAQPTVVAGSEGQIGQTPGQPSLDKVHAPGFAPVTIPGLPFLEGNVVLAHKWCNHQKGDRLPTSIERRRAEALWAKFGKHVGQLA